MPVQAVLGAQSERLIAGRYTIEEVLGRGGMAQVYRVTDSRAGRKLALKRGVPGESKKAQKRRALLEREYHTLAQLAHPRIIEVYDYGVDEGGPYYTMELLDGADLDQRGQLSVKQACELLRDVASSLAILHARGLIHRDVSLRNVRCTADGRAKLIDFGAMVSMGVAKDVVGTPPFMAPEVLQMQALDARADLFSLGALGYHLLTGRHAYPARRLSELRDVWRSRPLPPIKLAPGLPPALSALISELIMLDRNARPQSAAEVMERLCAIGGLPLEERIEVSSAYLATPTLVGRDQVLVAVRRRMLSLVRGDGGTLLIEGTSGSGRSRMLDAATVEGKLLGATVLRADAGDGASGDWGVARALCAQLLELLPKQATDAARLSLDVLGHVVEGLRGDASVSAGLPERSLLLRELRDFLLSLSRGQRLLLVIDDADRIDEPSLALLAALAHKTERHSLMLALTIERGSAHAGLASLRLLRSVAEPIELLPLDADQTLLLMRSLFGDVANLHLCAGRIHALSQGSPRAAMELAQHLVTRGLARYAAGSWSLPAQLGEHDLPSTLFASLAARLESLSADARELACALCLADGDPLSLDSYRWLSAHGVDARLFRALDELVAARVLVSDGERYRISQRGFMAVLQAAAPPEQQTAIHSRLADLLAKSGGDVLRRAHHLLHGGRDHEGIDLLCSIDLRASVPPLPLIELALNRAEQLALSPRTLHALHMGVLGKAPLVLAIDSFRRSLPPALARIEHDSGLQLYRELPELPESERLAQALARTQQRYQQTPESERGQPVFEALRELARLTMSFGSLAGVSFDLELLESVPSLEPLMPLSTALGIAELITARNREWLSGRRADAGQLSERLLARIASPDRGGFDEVQQNRTRLALLYSHGLYHASLGNTVCEEYAHALEGDREYRVSAWRIRLVMHINQGNAEEARKCLRRAELLQLQESSEQRYPGTSSALELIAYAQAGDLFGVKSAVETTAVLAERCPGWRPMICYGQCYQRWLRGDLAGALDALLPGLERGCLGRHPYACELAAAHVSLLTELGRGQEALELGERYLEICERERLRPGDRFIELAMTQVLARCGDHDRATRMSEALIARGKDLGATGLALGLLYEGRARVAVQMHDRETFERFAELCAVEYRKARNPALSQRLVRLMEEAQHNQTGSLEPLPAVKDVMLAAPEEAHHDTLESQMLECLDGSDRARWALTVLLQSTESCAGYLYGVWDGRVEVLAALPDVPAEEGLGSWVKASAQAELETEVTATATAEGDEEELNQQIAARYTDQEGRCFEAIHLIASDGRRLAAVLALQVTSLARSLPGKELLSEIADQLLKHDDVSGVAMAGPSSPPRAVP